MAAKSVSARRLQTIAPELALACGVLVSAVSMVVHARNLWFFGDDFDFLMNRSISFDHDHGLLVPHNEHWSTIPILVFRLNYALFGLHHYLPYALVPIALHVVISALGFVLLRLCGVGRWVSASAALVLAFAAGGGGAENPLWDFQVGFLGSCALGVLAMVAIAMPGGRRGWNVVAVVALVLALMSSGMGVVMLIWAMVFRLFRDGVRAAALTTAVPAAVYAAWYATYGRGHTGAPPTDLSVAPLAAVHGLGSVWSTATGMPGAGPVVLAAMLAAVLLSPQVPRAFALSCSGLVTAVVAYALLGYSRSGIGVDAAVRSRYVYFGVVLTIPALAAGLAVLGRRLRARPMHVSLAVWLLSMALVVGVGLAQADWWTSNRLSLTSHTRSRLAAAAELVGSGAPLLRTQPMPERNPDVDVASLEKPSVRAALPDVDPGALARLYVAANLQVDVGPAHSLAPATAVRWLGFGRPQAQDSGALSGSSCETRSSGARHPVVEVPLAGRGVELRMSVSGDEVGTQLVAAGHASAVVRWPVHRGTPTYVSSTATASTLRIQVPTGPVTICLD